MNDLTQGTTNGQSNPLDMSTGEAFLHIEAAIREINNSREQAACAARDISEIRGRVDADVGWFAATKTCAEDSQATVANIKAEVEAANRVTQNARDTIEAQRTSINAITAELEDLRKTANDAASQAGQANKAAAQHSIRIAQANETVTQATERVAALLSQAEEQSKKATEHSTEVSRTLDEVAAASEVAKGLVNAMVASEQKASETLSIIERHEADLARLKGECQALHLRIESLLPNATSAGLATAFRAQKARFMNPQRMWLGTFILAILCLLIAGLTGLPSGNDSWEAILRHLVNRLPLIAPLVWLAIYAGRHYGLALRLQEEYAYKEAVSSAFEGYKREMKDVGKDGNDGPNPLVTLCENVLLTLSQRPGRIYESNHEDITPLTSAVTALREAKNVVMSTGKPETTSKNS